MVKEYPNKSITVPFLQGSKIKSPISDPKGTGNVANAPSATLAIFKVCTSEVSINTSSSSMPTIVPKILDFTCSAIVFT